MEKIVYNKETGIIYGSIPLNQDVYVAYIHYDDEFKDKLSWIIGKFSECKNCKIIDGKAVPFNERELYELQKYGRFLSDEERLLEDMKPNNKEVEDSMDTIKVISLLEELI